LEKEENQIPSKQFDFVAESMRMAESKLRGFLDRSEVRLQSDARLRCDCTGCQHPATHY
jgi:hypothetical protein